MSRRNVADPDALQEYTIIRSDDADANGARLQDLINRKRVAYSVYRGRPEDLREQRINVHIERQISKYVSLGQRLHSDTGLSKDSTLLSAVSEWRTWIVLL